MSTYTFGQGCRQLSPASQRVAACWLDGRQASLVSSSCVHTLYVPTVCNPSAKNGWKSLLQLHLPAATWTTSPSLPSPCTSCTKFL